MSWRLRSGESPLAVVHLGVTRENALMFQVPISRLSLRRLAGTSCSALDSRPSASRAF
jgi:hypothetical protein